MPYTAIQNKQQDSLLKRFLGDDFIVLSREHTEVSLSIHTESLTVNFPMGNVPEEQGKLYLFPFDDGKFCLQLFFAQQAAGEAHNITVHALQFLPSFFGQYPEKVLMANQPFRFDQTTEQQFSICAKTRQLLEQLQQVPTLTPIVKALQLSEIATHVLRRSLECITIPFTACQVPACRFLLNENERDKVHEAIAILGQQIDQPLTIRELSRKVAMNECYLKKGFKALTGKTIHEYQQSLRINKARELLRQHGQSVSDVANTLGFSSISHFSTAFKKATGLKPCELLG